jgi:hypothetical protein
MKRIDSPLERTNQSMKEFFKSASISERARSLSLAMDHSSSLVRLGVSTASPSIRPRRVSQAVWTSSVPLATGGYPSVGTRSRSAFISTLVFNTRGSIRVGETENSSAIISRTCGEKTRRLASRSITSSPSTSSPIVQSNTDGLFTVSAWRSASLTCRSEMQGRTRCSTPSMTKRSGPVQAPLERIAKCWGPLFSVRRIADT